MLILAIIRVLMNAFDLQSSSQNLPRPRVSPMPHRHDPPPISAGYALSQTASISTLLKIGVGVPFKAKPTEEALAAVVVPGPLVSVDLPAVPQSLLDEYTAWTGGAADTAVPAHLFAQWTFPAWMSALSALPIPMTSVLNQGCRLEMHAPLPAGEAMQCTAQLATVEREPTKIKIATKITTGTASGPAYTALVHAVIPQKSKGPKAPKEADRTLREPATVPPGAECIAEHALTGASGRHYAFLSGDFNPIHWIGPAAKAAGFKTVILHGFAQMALIHEDLIRSRCAADPTKLRVLGAISLDFCSTSTLFYSTFYSFLLNFALFCSMFPSLLAEFISFMQNSSFLMKNSSF